MKFLLSFVSSLSILVAASSPSIGQFTIERVVGDLNQPIYMTQAPGDDNSLYIVERADPGNAVGRILQYDQVTNAKSTFLDLEGSIASDGGALSLAFHPDFQTNGKFYVTLNDNRVNRLDEYQLVGGAPQFRQTLLEYENLANNFHTINWIGFRPNGNNSEIFVTTGDGGTQANQGSFDSALIESLNSPYGKLMRVNLSVDYSAGPANDPTHVGVDVMALGLRNPYRASFDRLTGDMYIADVGFQTAEEVNYVPSSHFLNPTTPLDFGWTDREGTVATVANNAGGPGSPGDIEPIFDYAHSGDPLPHPSEILGGSITGGYLYRGPVQQLNGRYFFGDFVTQDIYSGLFDATTPVADYDGTNLINIQNHTNLFEAASQQSNPDTWVTSFAEDNAGNLYVVDFGEGFFPSLGEGELYRIVPLSELTLTIDRDTGAMTLTNLTNSIADVLSYELTSPTGAIAPAELTSISGNYDASLTGDGSVDANDTWQITSAVGSKEQFSEETTGDAGNLLVGVGVSLSVAGGWIPSPTEDVQLSVTLEGGLMISAQVVFVGNNDASFSRSDLNFDGVIDGEDWPILRDNANTDLSGLSLAEAYGLGDLDRDGDNDYDDFLQFRADFNAANGSNALETLLNVPEPTALVLLLATVGMAVTSRHRI